MRLILIRHGETPNNVLSLLDTSAPGAVLTQRGHAQAAAIPAALVQEKVNGLYISTLTRTALTAAPLAAQRSLQPVVRGGLREISAGEMEMKGDPDSVTVYLKTIRAWLSGDLSVRMPGAESGFEVLQRFETVVEEAAATGVSTVAMVSHGAMIRFWAGYRGNNIDWQNPKYHVLGNTGILTLEGTPGGSDAPGGWEILDWHGSPAGGLDGVDFAHADIARPDIDSDASKLEASQP